MITSFSEEQYGRPTIQYSIEGFPEVEASLEVRSGKPYAQLSWGKDLSIEYIDYDCEHKLFKDLASISSGISRERLLIEWMSSSNDGAIFYPAEMLSTAIKKLMARSSID